MKSEQNELLTRIGPGTACGAVLRRYWQPVALVDEFDPRLDPRMVRRPLKALRVLRARLLELEIPVDPAHQRRRVLVAHRRIGEECAHP